MDDQTAFNIAQMRIAELNENIAREKNVIADSQAKIVSHEKQLADLQSWISMWHKLTGTENPTASERIENVSAQKSIRPKNPDREIVVNAVMAIIAQRGRPQPRKDLFEALIDNFGIELKGKDPEMVLSTMLWRSKDDVVRLPGYGYWIKGLQWDEGQYYPSGQGGDLLDMAAKEPEDGQEADDADD
jgi:hypothetical protein